MTTTSNGWSRYRLLLLNALTVAWAASGGLDNSSFVEVPPPGSFPATYGSGAKTLAADLNNDGFDEVAVTGVDRIFVFANRGSAATPGTNPLDSPQELVDGWDLSSMAMVDVDGDDRLDLVGSFVEGFSVFRNASPDGGAVVFDPPVYVVFPYPPNGGVYLPDTALFAGDFDGDGLPEVGSWGYTDPTQTFNYASIMRNVSTPGTVAFTDYLDLPGLAASEYRSFVGDLNADGRIDVWFKGNGPSLMFLNQSTPASLAFSPQQGPPGTWAGAVGDVDGDGKADVISGLGAMLFIHHNASSGGAWVWDELAAVPLNSWDVVTGDLTGDGRADIALVDNLFDGSAYWLRVLQSRCPAGFVSASDFSNRAEYPLIAEPTSLALGDFDGDGRKDIAVTGYDWAVGDMKLNLWLNRYVSDPDTTPPVITAAAVDPPSLWPARMQMVPVTVSVEAQDDNPGACVIAQVRVNESSFSPGYGPDFEITGDLTVNLRARRLWSKGGRVYTIYVRCTDLYGNVSMETVTVTVPSTRPAVPKPQTANRSRKPLSHHENLE